MFRLTHILITTFMLTATIGLIARAQSRPSSDIRPLSLDGPIEREMKGGEVHSYSLALESGQFVYLLVDQRSIDVVVTVFGPDGKQLLVVDSLFWHGLEPVSMVVDATGSYRFEMRAKADEVPGRYLVNVIELRAATEQDKSRVAIEQQLDHAQRLQADRTAQSMQTAIGEFEQALPKLRAVGDLYREALTLYAIARIALDLGQYKNALDYFEQTLPFTRIAGYKFGEAEVLNNIGQVYHSLGEKDKALDYFAQALPLRRAVGDLNGEAATVNNLGAIYSSLGQYQKALEHYEKALPLMRAVDDIGGEATALNNIGGIYDALGQDEKALEWYGKALQRIRVIKDVGGEANTLRNIGLVHYHAGEKQKAVNYFIQSLPLSRAVGDRELEGKALGSLAHLYESQGKRRLATFYGKLSANVFQQLRSNAQGLDKNVQKTYLKSVETTYRLLADLLLSQGRLTEAHQVLNAFKDQQLFDFDQQRSFKPLTLTQRESNFAKRYENEGNDLATVLALLKQAEDEFSRSADQR